MEDFKPVAASQTTMTELMIPSYSNFGGKIHGGIILSLMDKVAYACAAKHADAYCVTASIDNVDFLASVEVGEIISLQASVNYVGNSSLVVGIKVLAENIKTRSVKHTNSSYFTMVALSEETQKPVTVPGLILQSETEVRRFIAALHRKELNRYYKQENSRIKSELTSHNYLDLLQKERCLLKIEP
ncbi:acyl-CoA thioesterase [Olivibacter sitiensis]|uniref:acyl-CoA thioesterase n=1 Tax=Olivibacter sitiensis TaxID=376470 RepID=UPI000419FB29|nr:acyl-CoA thioesterase [Olivibacter sitiensis]